MLQKILEWLQSELNIFLTLGCVFDIVHSPEKASVQSIIVDFELNNYLCRITFWESSIGHIEVIEIDSEKTFINESFDAKIELSSDKPFKNLAEKLGSVDIKCR